MLRGMWRWGLGALACCALAGCGEYKAPASFTVNDASVTEAVEGAINNGSGPHLASKPTVACDLEGGKECTIRYTTKEPVGISFDDEMIQPTRQIWKAMFDDPAFQSGQITVEGPTESQGGIKSTSPIYVLTCDRANDKEIAWDTVEASGIKSICAYHKDVK
jgi:hypothetical protein